MQGIFSLEKESVKLKGVWGGQDVVVRYTVSHIHKKIENLYLVAATIRGLNDFTPELNFNEVLQNLTNNSETVINDILIEELNACNASQLTGMEEI
jgi:hypothetical protein